MAAKLRDIILSEENIYNAIYALESYVTERDLLSADDQNKYHRLRDKYDFGGIISETIEKCQQQLSKILEDDKELFKINVFFKIKKLDSDSTTVEYRPLHTSDLISQICMASLLMPLMFDDSSGKRNLSELSRMLPHNFFGNIPSCNVSRMFMNWTDKYRQYSQIVNNKSCEYSKTREYDKEISFDLKDFFPSIDPKKILNFIWNSISGKYDEEDQATLKTVITKLLYFKIPEDNLQGWKDVYYKEKGDIGSVDGYYPARGIAQGLPQSYFFGNLCMISIAEAMNRLKELGATDSYFYVDDSVVFARNIDPISFSTLIDKLNHSIDDSDNVWKIDPILDEAYKRNAENINYKVEFHPDGKSTICDIDESFNGMDGLFLVQRPVSLGGWIKGNIDEVDDNVALKKLQALQKVVDGQLKRIEIERDKRKDDKYGESRQKWLRRYRRYFVFRQRKLQLSLNGEFDDRLREAFLTRFKINQINGSRVADKETLENLFEIFDEDIFKSEFELLVNEMPNKGPEKQKDAFCEEVKTFDATLSKINNENNRNSRYLYYYRIASTLVDSYPVSINEYDSLFRIVRRTVPFRSAERFLSSLKDKATDSDDLWGGFPFMAKVVVNDAEHLGEFNVDTDFPNWCRFIFVNSDNFKRKILNCAFSYVCNILPGDNLSILRSDIKPIKYYELRILAMLRNSRFSFYEFISFIHTIDCNDVTEKMDIDLGILEGLGIFRQRVQNPIKIDRLILTHRLVKSLWHNGSKFLNAYTLHNQEHAINLIKNVVRLINNVDFLNLKANDYFLLFNACYLHDISMVIHPNVASFNDTNANAEKLISKWLRQIIRINEKFEDAFIDGIFAPQEVQKIRKTMGKSLVDAFQDVFDFFENKVRSTHAYDSALYIRQWQEGMLSYLSELEADAIATVSDSHGWDTPEVYEIKSSAKEELVSMKYMMILIRLADLLDLANDRIDYFLLKQNRSQMNSVSRYHWISHLITDKYELDVDFDPDIVSEPNPKPKLSERPIKEHIHLDIFLNTEILAYIPVKRSPCQGFKVSMEKCSQKRASQQIERNCIEFQLGRHDDRCKICRMDGETRSCPFLCLWMSDRHWWLLSEFSKLNRYLSSVNSELIETDISVRFFYDNTRKLDAEFYDDVKSHLTK